MGCLYGRSLSYWFPNCRPTNCWSKFATSSQTFIPQLEETISQDIENPFFDTVNYCRSRPGENRRRFVENDWSLLKIYWFPGNYSFVPRLFCCCRKCRKNLEDVVSLNATHCKNSLDNWRSL
jgi:hypothetical protein